MSAKVTNEATTRPSSAQRITSAAVGATAVALLVTPFDVVKTRMQTSISASSTPTSLLFDSLHRPFQSLNASAHVPPLRPFKSTWDGLFRIAHYEGIPALWKGLTPALLLQAPSTILYYIGYEEIRNALLPLFPTSASTLYAPLLAGSLSRAATTFLVSPLELIRTRMQSGSGSDTTLRSVLDQVRGMSRTTGVHSLWRGVGPTLWRDVPFSAVYWVGYETMRTSLTRHRETVLPLLGEFGVSFVSGAAAGSLAAIVTTPFDVVKTLQQVVHHNEPGCGHDHKQMSMLNVMRCVYSTDGVRGLFVGLGPRVAKIAPACAIMISSYELGKRVFEGRNRNALNLINN